MAYRAGLREHVRTVFGIARLGGQRDWRRPASLGSAPGRHAGADEPDVRQHRLHFRAVRRQRAAVHAALHASVDTVLQRAHLVLAADELWKDAPDAGERQPELLRARIQMAVLTFEPIAGKP